MSNSYILKIKRNILPLFFLSFIICLLLFSNSNLPAVKSGLNLWANSVVPSLFPFFVATELLMHTNIVFHLGSIFNKFMNPIFNVPGEGSFAFIMGIISGYPVGAKIACNFRKNNICSKEECERLLSFTNNSGPLFVIGSVGISMFRSSSIGILLFAVHLLSCVSVGIIFRFWKRNKKSEKNIDSKFQSIKNKKIVTFSNLGEVLAECITNSISTILVIGGFIVIFSSLISIMKSSGILNILNTILSPAFSILKIDNSFIPAFITGFLEVTNGIHIISVIACKQLSINIIMTSFLLGFGGISILLQVFSIISKSDLSIKPYIYGKFLQGLFSAFYTFVFINIFPFFNFDL